MVGQLAYTDKRLLSPAVLTPKRFIISRLKVPVSSIDGVFSLSRSATPAIRECLEWRRTSVESADLHRSTFTLPRIDSSNIRAVLGKTQPSAGTRAVNFARFQPVAFSLATSWNKYPASYVCTKPPQLVRPYHSFANAEVRYQIS